MEKQKMKHNKKRNTAFLYETLIQEMTKAIVDKDKEKHQNVLHILKEHFSKGKLLHHELSLYKSINETKGMQRTTAEKILFESKVEYDFLPKEKIFAEQSRVINKINKKVGPSVFSNFVKNYKDLATISQIFNGTVPVKERVLLEEEVVNNMCQKEVIKEDKQMVATDKLVYKTFVKKFNDKYGDTLLSEQKDLLTNYLVSFSDNGLSLKIFLNEELARVKTELKECLELKEIKEDKEMFVKTNKIIENLELFKKKEFDQHMLSNLLKIQNFINEAKLNNER
jgi:flagellin-specific chaperone FliS